MQTYVWTSVAHSPSWVAACAWLSRRPPNVTAHIPAEAGPPAADALGCPGQVPCPSGGSGRGSQRSLRETSDSREAAARAEGLLPFRLTPPPEPKPAPAQCRVLGPEGTALTRRGPAWGCHRWIIHLKAHHRMSSEGCWTPAPQTQLCWAGPGRPRCEGTLQEWALRSRSVGTCVSARVWVCSCVCMRVGVSTQVCGYECLHVWVCRLRTCAYVCSYT